MWTLKHNIAGSVSANGNIVATKIQRKWKLLKSVLNFLLWSSRVCLFAIGQEAQFELCSKQLEGALSASVWNISLQILQSLSGRINHFQDEHVQTVPAISLLSRPRHMHHWSSLAERYHLYISTCIRPSADTDITWLSSAAAGPRLRCAATAPVASTDMALPALMSWAEVCTNAIPASASSCGHLVKKTSLWHIGNQPVVLRTSRNKGNPSNTGEIPWMCL